MAANGLVGRVRECEQAVAGLRQGHNVLVKGRAGVGKSTVLQAVSGQLKGEIHVVDVPAMAAKQSMLEVARQLHEQVGLLIPARLLPPRVATRARQGQQLVWKDIARSVRREPVDQLVEHITRTLRQHRVLLVIDSLEVPPTFANALSAFAEHAQLLAGMDDTNRRVRIARLLWQFNLTVEVKSLTLQDSEALIQQEIERHAPRFADHRTERLFVRHIAQASGGVPAAMVGMMDSARGEERITPAKVRDFDHEAGTRYLDMTPLLIIVLVGAMAARYIGRGIGEVELMVLSGVSTAVFMGLRYFLVVMRR